ncbi:NAD(P)H dehydrogenase (quinone) [Amycolatopsis bartoniae]|uniref:NAD(P)-dependent oxidoreductase n=1 Tax=Amycolatopsis bartoniae TaxID=941986 RepID=A0A8H9IWW5_9PSEU|nr:SDR family oxidoreductase [Amycolatopsis bartoniae]MBB2939142.1 NAD(P)H dehydrogenase (quinone) [Amycolatopsis bartoniae]TVT01393.1 SDR family oxidoreductase [Amycolatopsis bartoniae]GHF64635.1 NAD(P)-dependent oxidoreductase [Amycolatopsis bartoniae]
MIVVTGATGQLGRLVVAGLKEKLPADQVVAAVRSPEKARDLGVTVRKADYNEPATLAAAFEGADKVLLVSGSEVGSRVPQHRAVVEAAQQAGVSLLVYTSAPKADTSPLILAPEHKATEEIIRESGLPYVFLRNGWYNENYEQTVQQAVQTGGFVGSAGEGRTASAARADYAAAAVAVLTGEGHANKIYELSGDVAWTRSELAATISEVAGKPVTYTNLTPEQHKAALLEAGLPEGTADFVVALDGNTRDGLLGEITDDLRQLIGRPTTPIADTVAEIVKSL